MHQQDEPEPSELQQQLQATRISDTPQIVRPEECGVCVFVYDELERRPRCLPCGHIYCSVCVSALLQDGHLICPSCRTDHCASEVNHFPICYPMEAMIKVMRTQRIEAASQAAGEIHQATSKGSQATEAKTNRRSTAGLSRKLRSMIQEQKGSIESLETTLQKELEQLNQYRAELAVCRTDHAHLLKELDKLVKRHQASMDLVQEEDERVEGFVEEGKDVQRELKAAQCQLDQINTAQETITTIDAVDHTVVEVEEWLQHSREEIPNTTVLSTSFMMLEATKTALKLITKETEATPEQLTSGHLNCTIIEAVETINGGPVELVNLRSAKLMKPLEAGRVFATQKYEDGTCNSSKVICKENKLYLHALKNDSPPRMAFTLQMSKVLENLNYCSISVFLDLAWPGTLLQRVRINLGADTPLIRQFVTLCLGHTGLTYCNTTLLRVENYHSSRIVWGGDITGQKAADNQVLHPINYTHCGNTASVNKGKVVARTDRSSGTVGTQFGIIFDVVAFVSFHQVHHSYPALYYLGSVEGDGLSVVQRAVNNSGDLTQVRVVDCGVVC